MYLSSTGRRTRIIVKSVNCLCYLGVFSGGSVSIDRGSFSTPVSFIRVLNRCRRRE